MQSLNMIHGRSVHVSVCRRRTITCTIAPRRDSPSFSGSGSQPSTSSSTSTSDCGLHGRAVEEHAMRVCIEQHKRNPNGLPVPKLGWSSNVLDGAYSRCAEVTSEYAKVGSLFCTSPPSRLGTLYNICVAPPKTFYLGTQLMTPSQAKAIWAIYVWCRRTDELVDGPNANQITPEVSECNYVGTDCHLCDVHVRNPLGSNPFPFNLLSSLRHSTDGSNALRPSSLGNPTTSLMRR